MSFFDGTLLYAAAAPCWCDDDFSSLDTSKWTETDANSVMTVSGGVLSCYATGSGDKTATLDSTFELTGDFDIQIDFLNCGYSNLSTSMHYGALRVFQDTSYVQIGRTRSVGYNGYTVNDSASKWQEVFDQVTSGKLRLVRSGSTFKGYIWKDNQWQWNGSTAGVTFNETISGAVTVKIYFKQESGSNAIIDFDNFKINSGPPAAPDTSPAIDVSIPAITAEAVQVDNIDAALPSLTAYVTDFMSIFGDNVTLPLLSAELEDVQNIDTSLPLFQASLTGPVVIDTELPAFDSGTGPRQSTLLHEDEICSNIALPLFSTFASTATTCSLSPIKITIDSSKIAEPLKDFPLRVNLASGGSLANFDPFYFFFALGSAGKRKKIKVTLEDEKTQCYVEIEPGYSFDNETMTLWVKVPFVSATADTILYLYYDPEFEDNSQYVGDTGDVAAKQVWDASYLSVLHMAQAPNGALSIKDSTSNQNHFDANGDMDANDLVDGSVGKAISFTYAYGDYHMLWGDTSLSEQMTGDITVEAFTTPSADDNGRVVNLDDSHYFVPWAIVGGDTGGVPWAYMLRLDDEQNVYSTQKLYGTAGSPIYTAGLLDISEKLMLSQVNNQKASTTYSGGIAGLFDETPVFIGARPEIVDFYEGIIDEVRLSNVARSEAWRDATYYSLVDQLVSIECPYTPESYDERIRWVFHSSHVYDVKLPLFRATALGNAILDGVTLPKFEILLATAGEIHALVPRFDAEGEMDADNYGSISRLLPKLRAQLGGVAGILGDIDSSLPKIKSYMYGSPNRIDSISVQMKAFIASGGLGEDVDADIAATLPVLCAAAMAKNNKDFVKLMYRQHVWD